MGHYHRIYGQAGCPWHKFFLSPGIEPYKYLKTPPPLQNKLAIMPEEFPNIRCGGDGGELLQMEMEDRKIAFRKWARDLNMASEVKNHSGEAFVGYLSSNPEFKLPWPDAEVKKFVEMSHQEARNLENDADMGLNSWIRVFYLHEKNPSLPTDARHAIIATFLTFQYWPPDEPRTIGDRREQVFWSENHQIMYSTIELLAGQKWPSEPFRDGQLGHVHRERAERRVRRWLSDRLAFGFSEWNSAGYYEYEILPLLNLVDFCEDRDVATRAAMALDILLFDLARFTQRGSFGVTAGRIYDAQKSSGRRQSVGDVIEILFGTRGEFIFNNSPSAHALATTTRYCVPSVLLAIGRHQPARSVDRTRVSVDEGEPGAPGGSTDEDALAWWARGGYVLDVVRTRTLEMCVRWGIPVTEGIPAAAVFAHLPIVAQLAHPFFQGLALTRANLYTYRDAGAMLSSAQGFRPGQVGFQTNAWQVTIDTWITVWATYASRLPVGQPSYWTGSVVNPFVFQRESAAIAIYVPDTLSIQAALGQHLHLWFPFRETPFPPDEEVKDFINSWKTQFDDCQIKETTAPDRVEGSVWIFGLKATPDGEAYVGIYSAQPCKKTEAGPWAGKEIVFEGLRNALVIQVGSSQTFGSFEDFMAKCQAARVRVSTKVLDPNPARPIFGLLADDEALVSFDSPDPILATTPGGHRLQVNYDQREARFGDKVVDIGNFPRFENLYTRTPWGSKTYTIEWEGLSLSHDVERGVREGHGTAQRQFIGQFNMITSERTVIYSVQANGELHWHRHLIRTDKTPRPAPPRRGPLDRPPKNQVPGQRPLVDLGARPQGAAVAQGSPLAKALTPVIEPPPPADPNPGVIFHEWKDPEKPGEKAEKLVGTGWNQFRLVTAGGSNVPGPSIPDVSVYAVTAAGGLKWYRHEGFDGGLPRWKGPTDVPGDWSQYNLILGGSDGVLYGRTGDGTLHWYRHGHAGPGKVPAFEGPKVVGTGWNKFVQLMSAGGGVWYGVDAAGQCWCYRHLGHLTGNFDWAPETVVARGFPAYKHCFAGANGKIYAVSPGGTLYLYQHRTNPDGTESLAGPARIGAPDWARYRFVFPMVSRPGLHPDVH